MATYTVIFNYYFNQSSCWVVGKVEYVLYTLQLANVHFRNVWCFASSYEIHARN